MRGYLTRRRIGIRVRPDRELLEGPKMQAIHRPSIATRAAAAGLVVLAGAVSCSGQEQPQLDRGLKILYVGRPGSDREKDFGQFLGQHFAAVKTADLSVFREFLDEDAEGFDVAIFDYDGGGLKAPEPTVLPRFLDEDTKSSPSVAARWLTRPLITVGVAGGQMCGRWDLKTGHM